MPSLYVTVALLIGLLLWGAWFGVASAQGADEAKGIWPMPNKDPQNTSRADLPGAMCSAPREVWRFGHRQHKPSYVCPVKVGSMEGYLISENGRLQLVRADGEVLWHIPFGGASGVMGVIDSPRGPRLLVRIGAGILRLLDLETGRELWRWTVPEGAHSVQAWKLQRIGGAGGPEACTRLIMFPTGAVNGNWGYCFQFDQTSDEPKLVWKKQYGEAYAQNFGPLIVLCDMDKDGRPEVVLAGKPATVVVIDSDTGEVKFKLRYQIPGDPTGYAGRPYGLLHAGDLDGDGYPDVVVAGCAVEEYLAVLRNVDGKGLELAWAQFIEKDFPDNERELLPNHTSVADIDGDGRKELVVGLYNMQGDGEWHTIAFGAAEGFDSRKLDLAGRYFWGCYDLNDDGRPEIIVSERPTRGDDVFGRVEAIDGRSGQVFASLEKARVVRNPLAGRFLPMPDATAFWHGQAVPLVVPLAAGRGGIVVELPQQGERVWALGQDGAELVPFEATALARALIGSQAPARPVALDLSVAWGNDSPGPAASSPLVAVREGHRELIMALGDGTITGGAVDLASPGVLRGSWVIPGTKASVWQGQDGRSAVVAAAPDRKTVGLWFDPGGQAKPMRLLLAAPVAPGAGPIPFETAGHLGLLVPMQRAMHAQAFAVYDESGQERWSDGHHGPYPRGPAIADLDGDGEVEFIVDDHGRQAIYDSAGVSHLFAQAWHNTVPGRGDGSAYALPIVGPFGPDGQLRIVMSPGIEALEVLDSSGRRLVKRDFEPNLYAFQRSRSAVGQCGPDRGWRLGMIDWAGRFHCADLATGLTRWTLDLGCPILEPVHIVAGDVNGDGQDEFVVGMPDGTIWALGEGPDGGQVVWKAFLDYGVREIVLADIDGDGAVELIVSTADGLVRILR